MEEILNQTAEEIEKKVVQIDRISRVVKGGRRLRFRALVVVGNKKGRVGIGLAKGNEVIIAINKATRKAEKNLTPVTIYKDTIPYEITYKFKGARVILKPARPGTGIIAGGAVRAVVEAAGIKNILSKILGSSNKINNIYATFLALQKLKLKNETTQSKKKEK